ncbi:MAG: polar amino acid transport system substrate-binding protein [Microbacteriaceae bacterium]|jgi:polar amino acid transport system substrate-binding protein|nr:polar amino acid transport system substrate-binding protein [Microbacteriaceae bacterium]
MRIRYAAPALFAVAALALTGCVNNDQTTPGATTTGGASIAKDDALAALLPANVKSAGQITVGIDPTYPPNEYKDSSGNPIGWEVDLMNAVGDKLGVKINYSVAKFDNIIPSVVGGKDDIGLSSFTDTVEREKQVDFINYYTAGIQWASPAGKTVDPNSACGLKVGVQATTFEDTDEVPAKSKACTDAGKPAIQIFKYDTQDAATNALVLGQIDALSADSPVTLAAVAKTKGKLQAAGDSFDVAPYGIATAKGSKITPAIQKTFQALIDDGTYGTILKKWGVESGGVTSVTINAASKG